MRATCVVLSVFCAITVKAVPIPAYHDDTRFVGVVVVDSPLFQEIVNTYGDDDDNEWKQEEVFTEGAMGKRSIALGRSGFRPGKRSVGSFHTVDVSDLIMKRSMAIGRLGLRPGKRSMAYGRQGFRPGKRSMAYARPAFHLGKRSMAYGRQGFRPGKRSADDVEFFPRRVPKFFVI